MLAPPAQGQSELLQCAGTSLDGQSKESSAHILGCVVELKKRSKWLLCGQKLTLNVVNR